MKKIRKSFLSILLICVMICLPVSQAMAAVSYDASAGLDEEFLFPGDSLNGIGVPVLMDGSEVALDTPGTWTNTDEERVFAAAAAEDLSSISLTAAGYVLVVEKGTSEKNEEGADNSQNHYEFPEGEEPEVHRDRAFYQEGETVKLKADEPEEGMMFAGWEAEGVSIEDPASPETTMTMPGKKVKVTATYKEETLETDPASEDAGTGDGTTDPASEDTGTVDVTTDLTPEDAGIVDVTTDPASEDTGAGDGTTDPASEDTGTGDGTTDPTPEDTGTGDGTTDPTPEDTGTVDVTIDPAPGDTGTDIVIDPSENGGNEDGTVSYSVTVNNGTADNGTGSNSFAKGDWVTVTANDRTEEGYEFTGWYVDTMNASPENLSSAITGFTMPAGDVTISATYKETQTDSQSSQDPSAEPQVQDPEQQEVQEPSAEPQVQDPEPSAEPQEVQEPAAEPQEVQDPEPAADPQEVEEPAAEPQEVQDPEPTKYTVTLNYATIKDSAETSFAADTSVTVVADVRTDEVFSEWVISQENGTPITYTALPEQEATFTMPASNVTVTALYTGVTKYMVYLTDGVINDANLTNPAQASYAAETAFQIAAADKENKQFAGWTAVDASGNSVTGIFADASSATTTVTMPAYAVTITANYADIPVTYQVTVANGLINGTASSMTVSKGDTITVTANPNPAGQAFSGWSITDASGNAVDPTALGVDAASSTITVAVSQALNFQAQYAGVPYAITVSSGSANYTTAVSGTSVTITADKAPTGMEFDYWTVNTGNISLANAYSATTTFTMPMADVTVTATYRKAEYSLTVKNGSSDEDYYYQGETATVSSNYPDSGKEFAGWEAVSGNVTFADASRWQTTLKMPASDVTVRATYKDGPSVYDNLILGLEEGGEYYAGDTLKFTASGAGMDNTNPNPGDYRYRPVGYQIGSVTGSWNDSPYTISMAINATGEYTLKVTFNKEVYDGTSWNADGTSDTRSVTFRVINKAAGVATGDSTQLLLVASIAVVSCLLVIILLVVFIRRRRRRR